MLHLASHEFAGRRVLLIENDLADAVEMTRSIEAAGGMVAGCVATGLATISYVKLWKVDAVVAHTETLSREPFPLNEVMASLNVALMPVASFDDWFAADDENMEEHSLSAVERNLAA